MLKDEHLEIALVSPKKRINALHPIIAEHLPAPDIPHAVRRQDWHPGFLEAEMVRPQLAFLRLNGQRRNRRIARRQFAEDFDIV